MIWLNSHVKTLLNKDANADVIGKKNWLTKIFLGNTPLEIAIMKQNLQLVNILLDKGVNPNLSSDVACAKPLTIAMNYPNIEIQKALKNSGGTLGSRD